jgi:hypothetical protein
LVLLDVTQELLQSVLVEFSLQLINISRVESLGRLPYERIVLCGQGENDKLGRSPGTQVYTTLELNVA